MIMVISAENVTKNTQPNFREHEKQFYALPVFQQYRTI